MNAKIIRQYKKYRMKVIEIYWKCRIKNNDWSKKIFVIIVVILVILVNWKIDFMRFLEISVDGSND